MLNKVRFKSLILISFSLLVFSCKKDKLKEDEGDTDSPTATTDRTELTKDSIFLYAKQVYLWNSSLPTYATFKPRSYSSLTGILLGIASKAIDPSTGKSYEYWEYFDEEPKFSYVDDSEVESGSIAVIPGSKSYVDLDGTANDIGLGLIYVGSETNYRTYVRYVSPGSPAAIKGIKRGTIINRINGVTYGSNFYGEIDNLINAIDGNTVTLNITAPNNAASTVTLTKTAYTSSPIYKDTVFTVESNNIGYLAYARFSDAANSEAALNAVFSNFASKSVNTLIIDLRYNGGGYVSTAEKLVNLIIPQQHNGKLMFTETFNETMQKGQATLLKNQFYTDGNGRQQSYFGTYSNVNTYVDKSASNYLTNVQKVVFIVGGSTASASELVINGLKPYVSDVKLIGEQTFGKPVGFFPIRIDKYDIYYSMFETRNSLGTGGYYSGMTVDKEVDDYPYNKEFGDPTEKLTAAAVAYLTTGSFPSTTASKSSESESAKVLQSDKTLQREGFKGMIETPTRLFGR